MVTRRSSCGEGSDCRRETKRCGSSAACTGNEARMEGQRRSGSGLVN
ncbi:unnamed protein product [Linum tenue]|uniref:Uncharacterized protein n=1 Tax=Linum tenue TaxID=586396 RepID=A0AAV0RQI8_9ROSI|nr:unnamed protein product [Linum tenue]